MTVRDRLYSAMRNYSTLELDIVLNCYIWLTYNKLTLEDLRAHIDYLRYKKDLIERVYYPKPASGTPLYRKELSTLSPALTKADVMSVIGYHGLRAWRKISKVIDKWGITASELGLFISETRKALLEAERYGKVRE